MESLGSIPSLELELIRRSTMNNHEPSIHSYRVKVGHAEVVVRARSPKDAIAAARRKLALELPRLYDIIRGLDPARFEVRAA